MRDAGRYTKHIQDKVTASVAINTAEITLASNIIEVDLVYWLPGDGRQIPLSGQSYDQMDNVWGSWQNLQSGTPGAYSLWGVPPNLKMKLFPTPDAAGTVSMLVVRMPADAANTSATIDWPPAWEDLLEDYVEMAALRRARDQRWQEAFAAYTGKRDNLDLSAYDRMTDQFTFDGYAGMMPRWLVDPRY
jgi:hypothetical protein